MGILSKIFEFLGKLFSTAAKAEDAVVEAINEEFHHETPTEPENIDLVAENHCEHLVCKKCGKEYNSSGLHDIGICEECIEKENFIGGPLGK